MGDKNNTYAIDISKKIEERTNQNYPLAGKKAQKCLKEANMKIAENNQFKYLSVANPRFQRFQKPLTGYIDKRLEKRLEYTKNLVFTGFKNSVHERSENLNQLRDKENKLAKSALIHRKQLPSEIQTELTPATSRQYINKNLTSPLYQPTDLPKTGMSSTVASKENIVIDQYLK